MPRFLATRPPARHGTLAIRFIATAAVVYFITLAWACLLIWRLPVAQTSAEALFPPVFWLTTLLLIAGSACLGQASRDVRREKQRSFRLWLLAAMALGMLFVGTQAYGLRCLALHQRPDETQTGANAFGTVLSTLHAMHFALALLFLVWITINAFADRYDHEYSWGVTLCAWFWHVLGVVWGMILVVFLVATQ